MEHRLRLVGESPSLGTDRRTAQRRAVAVPGQIVWKDARGMTRIMAVRTRDVSEDGVSVECLGGTPIPRFRLVHFQVDREARSHLALPSALKKASVLCAVFRVGPSGQATGSPGEYALRLLAEPHYAGGAESLSTRRAVVPLEGERQDFLAASSSRRASVR